MESTGSSLEERASSLPYAVIMDEVLYFDRVNNTHCYCSATDIADCFASNPAQKSLSSLNLSFKAWLRWKLNISSAERLVKFHLLSRLFSPSTFDRCAIRWVKLNYHITLPGLQ